MRAPALLRFLTIALVLAAWFALTNHCALATFSAVSATAECPMHSQPAPQKQEPAPVCCKIVRAVSGSTAIAKVAPPTAFFLSDEAVFPGVLLHLAPQFQVILLALDTGPPGSASFAEAVLQQSLLAHAPPARA